MCPIYISWPEVESVCLKFIAVQNQTVSTIEFLSFLKDFWPLITASALAAGLAPRVGPGRAAWIAFRSRFAFKPVPESLRYAEIDLLKRTIAQVSGQGYLVVTGEKGVVKSCLVNTAVSKTAGVIKVVAQPGESSNTIIYNVLYGLTAPPFKFMDPLTSAPKVLFWYRLFTFGRSPIVVINTTERKLGEGYASLTGAVRTLVDKYKFRVIVDASPNSLDESLLRTTRQIVFEIKPMTKEMIWKMEQLQDLFKYVNEAGLDDVVFAVLGGLPSRYEELWRNTMIHLQSGQNPRTVIGAHLCNEISNAVTNVRVSKTKTNDMDEIIKLFDKEKCCIICETVTVKKLQRPTPDKVFREKEQDGEFVLVPASDAIGIVLRHSLTQFG